MAASRKKKSRKVLKQPPQLPPQPPPQLPPSTAPVPITNPRQKMRGWYVSNDNTVQEVIYLHTCWLAPGVTLFDGVYRTPAEALHARYLELSRQRDLVLQCWQWQVSENHSVSEE